MQCVINCKEKLECKDKIRTRKWVLSRTPVPTPKAAEERQTSWGYEIHSTSTTGSSNVCVTKISVDHNDQMWERNPCRSLCSYREQLGLSLAEEDDQRLKQPSMELFTLHGTIIIKKARKIKMCHHLLPCMLSYPLRKRAKTCRLDPTYDLKFNLKTNKLTSVQSTST